MAPRSFIFTDRLRKLLKASNIFTDWGSQANKRINNGNRITVAPDTTIEPYILVYAGNTFCTMGAFSFSGSKLYVNYKIGRYCSLGKNIELMGGRHPYERISSSTFTYFSKNGMPWIDKCVSDLSHDKMHNFIPKEKEHIGDAEIYIGHDVWIGNDVLLKPGIKIGQGAVIAQRSIVTHDVPAYSVWGGCLQS